MSFTISPEHRLGVTCHEQGNYAAAIAHYRSALHDYHGKTDAFCLCHYHLSLSYSKQNRSKKAIESLHTILAIHPNHFASLYRLGIEHMKQTQYEAAIQTFRKAEKIEQQHVELQINLGHCYLNTQQDLLARDCYYYALELDAQQIEPHFNLGVLCTKENLSNQAIQHYFATIAMDAQHFGAHYNVALLLVEKQYTAKAIEHLRIATSLNPSHAGASFLLKALEQDPAVTQTPLSHIEALFDQYADSYDKHLVIALDYQLPQQLYQFYQALHPHQYHEKALDLGCGTGLCGQAFKDITKQLKGVDIAALMLAQARKKNIYTELYQQDICLFLKENTETYSLIFAADVLMYTGELDTLFSAIYPRLSENGKLLFNIEEGKAPPYRVGQSGRFLHHPGYILQLAEHHGFVIERAMSAHTRQQNNQPVHGLLYCLTKRGKGV